ncbi:Cell division protein FtsK [Chondromyces apiculatus DSM 436]|uniref:Cell division protein FtsK n=1 Tax=Chondromyces apiculatus DSM 436 TaxID=1192034 RepID=A0A017TBJ4_9BACT|nr:Cell division protein FtsK [Chondromyces apiculatus DSM 436]
MLLTSALYCALALASFQADRLRPEIAGADWVGPVGAAIASSVVGAVGAVSWFLPLELALLASPLLAGRRWLDNDRRELKGVLSATVSRISGDIIVVVVLAALAHVAFPEALVFGAMPLGGAVGELFGEILRALFSSTGSYIIGSTVVALILIGRATFSFIELVQRIERLATRLAMAMTRWARSLVGAWTAASELERRGSVDEEEMPRIERNSNPDAIIAALSDDEALPPSESATVTAGAATLGTGHWTTAGDADPPSPPAASETKQKRARRTRAAGIEVEAAAQPLESALATPAPTVEIDATTESPAAGEVHPPASSAGPKIMTTPAMLPRSPVELEPPVRALDLSGMIEEAVREDAPLASPTSQARGANTEAAPARRASPPQERAPRARRRAVAIAVEEQPEPAPSEDDEGAGNEELFSEASLEGMPSESSDPIVPPVEPSSEELPLPREGLRREGSRRASPRRVQPAVAEISEDTAAESEDDDADEVDAEDAHEEFPRVHEQPAPRPAAEARGPHVVNTRSTLEPEKPVLVKVIPSARTGFVLPSTEMLESASTDRMQIDEAQLKEMAQLLEKTLADYGVSGKVEEIHPGPTVTTFEVSPAPGTKVSKVAGLADDLALGLSRKVRIVAPIPGKNRIGFEIPNEQRLPVNLRDLVEDRRFLDMKAPLPCVLGRDIIGTPYFADLASMPHVIVAGATGAGKSVGLNVMLVSLLFRRTPEELRLLMIDPKVVELAPFDRIPHMLLPVVTDMKQAATALKWAVDEMERRYQLFANAGTKNITTYNGWVERVRRGDAKPPKAAARVSAVAHDGSEVEVPAARDGSDAELPMKLPFIVIVVDEFADLMMQQGKDVEASVARLAQKARAAGMHVILATQRPSVDVITGMIKANFPTRVAFRVAQKVDSRTILDEQGAEHLLGRGDMLVKMNGANDTRRVQCPFCSEEEVQRITDFLRSQGEPVYDEAILQARDEEDEETDTADLENDAMYDAAVRVVADTRRCSTSWIQRKLGIGYNRAAKLVEAMEKRGLVGPANGAKDREVLISPV